MTAKIFSKEQMVEAADEAWMLGGVSAVACLRDSIVKKRPTGNPEAQHHADIVLGVLNMYLGEMDPTGEWQQRLARLG